jgi:hypothetical protein
MNNLDLFISYRSPSYEDLKKNNCVIQNGEICQFENAIFNSCKYNDCIYKKASWYADGLRKNGRISSWYLMPPQALIPSNVVMVPIDFMELLPVLYEALYKSKFFLRFCVYERGDSFWTLLEREIWRRHQSANDKIPQEYSVINNSDIFTIEGPLDLKKMSKNGIALYTRLKLYIMPEPMTVGHFWGRYARSVLVQQCLACGNLFGVSAKAFSYLKNEKIGIVCPKCAKGYFYYQSAQDKIRKYTFRYSYEGERNPLFPIHPDTMFALLLDNTKHCPQNIPLYCMSRERFPKEEELAGLWPLYLGKSLINLLAGESDLGYLVLRYYNNKKEFIELKVKRQL